VDDRKLKYRYLAEFDRAMIRVIRKHHILKSMFAQQLNMDTANKTVVFERNNLIFLFNFHPQHSIPDYGFRVPRGGRYEVILNTDNKKFGGHGRLDETISYPTDERGNEHFLRIYATNRTAIVLKIKKA
jgi:1,4-alpha-glucan branching enzyme